MCFSPGYHRMLTLYSWYKYINPHTLFFKKSSLLKFGVQGPCGPRTSVCGLDRYLLEQSDVPGMTIHNMLFMNSFLKNQKFILREFLKNNCIVILGMGECGSNTKPIKVNMWYKSFPLFFNIFLRGQNGAAWCFHLVSVSLWSLGRKTSVLKSKWWALYVLLHVLWHRPNSWTMKLTLIH